MIDVLIFAAHPDDAELSMGGTILSLKNSGKSIAIIDFTKGELSTKGTLESRLNETDNASEIMNLDVRENLDLGDGRFEETEENRHILMDIIRKYKPSIIFAPFKTDRHPDHERCSRMVREAHFYSGLKNYKTDIDEYRAKQLYFYMGNNVFDPSFIYDISDFMDGKIELVKAYATQFFNKKDKSKVVTTISRPEFMEFISAKARFYGEMSGVKYGEAFYYEQKLAINSFKRVKFKEIKKVRNSRYTSTT